MPIRKVTDPALLQQLNADGNVVAPNPMFPGQMQGQGLNNVGQAQTNQRNALEMPYVAPKAAADATRAQTEAGVAAATAPAEIKTKTTQADKAQVDLNTALANFLTTGGAGAEQAKSGSFYTRATRSNDLYEGTGVKDNPASHVFAQTVLPEALVNTFTSPARQQAEAAQKDFIAATLRYESGANLPPSEFDTQRQIFFPAPGDDPATIELKAKLRRNAIEGLKVAAGPSAPILDANREKITQSAALPDAVDNPAETGVATTTANDVLRGKMRNELDRETSVAVDRLIRQNRPVSEIVAYAKSKGFTEIDEPAIAAARLYLKQHPNYKGGFTRATRQVPMTLGERVSGSALGSTISAAGTGATLGGNDELAGVIAALGGGDYEQGRDAFNAKKHLIAEAHPYGDLAGTVIGSLGPMGAAGKLAGGAKAATLADIGTGATFGALENNDNRALGALEGAAGAGVGNVAGRGLAKGLASTVSPTGGRMASLYDLGVRPSIGQRAGGIVNNLEEKAQSFPFLGDMIAGTRQRARDQFQVGLFNKSLGEIGQELPKGVGPGHDAHAFSQGAFNKAYDAAKSSMTAAADGPLANDLGAVQRTVGTLKPDSQKTFNKVWADSVARRFSGGALSGPAFKDATSEMERKIAAIRGNQAGDGELADALQEAVDAIKGSAMRNSPPEAVAAMEAADRGYTTLVQLENASKSAGGDAATFSPKQFESAVKNGNSTVRKRGYLAGSAPNTDLAEAGLRLGDSVSNSGTIDRLAPMAVLGGIGALSPKVGGAMTLYSLLNAPGVRNLTTGLLAPRGGKARTIADLMRQQLPGPFGAAGSALGIGLLPSN